jgi:hypothetical protein
MSSTTFVNYQTVIDASWLNDVNALTYDGTVQAPTLSPNDLAVTGDATIDGTTSVGGALTASSTLDVNGAFTANSTVGLDGVTSFGTYANIKGLFETATVSASAPTSTTNFDILTQAVKYYTADADTNFTLNIRGSSGTTLNSILGVGQSATMAVLVTNGATAYYMSNITIDGASATVKWFNAAPTSGNPNSLDSYLITVIKTASATFTVLANQSSFV